MARPASSPKAAPARPAPGPRRAGALALAAALVALGVGAWLSGARRSPSPAAAAGHDLLLVTVDTLRADALGAYGGHPGTAPVLDRLARGGVRFEDAHAHNVLTLPSHANILSGLYPQQHGVRDNAGFRFPAALETLATRLRAHGYRTGAFVSAFPLDARFGLARGFDVYDDELDEGRAGAFLEPERAAPETVARARRFLAQGGAPAFVWVHVFEPHFPYAAPPKPGGPDEPYLLDVAAADAGLAPLLEPLLAQGARGRTLVALTSDHGEALGEHGEATHGLLAYEATLRVPLVLFDPALLEPRVVRSPVGHVDLLPTLLDALGLRVPAGLPGRSLLAEARGAPAGAPATCYFEALAGALQRGWAPLQGVIAGGHKYIDTPLPEVYDLRVDAAESRNLAGSAGAGLEHLRAELRRLRALGDARAPDPRAESADVRARLASLGYLSGSAVGRGRVFGPDDDPKRRIAGEGRLQSIVALALAGRGPEARHAARALAREQPGMAVAWMHLAQLERDAGDLHAGIGALRQAVTLRPEDDSLRARLAAYLTEAGRAAEAVTLLASAAAASDPDLDVLTTQALALARLGRADEALAALDRARKLDPHDARLLLHAGTLRLTAGRRAEARADFEAAVARRPALAAGWSALGLLALEDGRRDEGLAHWRRALDLDERELPKLLVLGAALLRQGRADAGRACLELFLARAPTARYAGERAQAAAWLRGGA